MHWGISEGVLGLASLTLEPRQSHQTQGILSVIPDFFFFFNSFRPGTDCSSTRTTRKPLCIFKPQGKA